MQRVIDLRERRIGQLAGFAKYPDLTFFLDRIAGISYIYLPVLAPSAEMRKSYRATKDWAAYEAAFLQLMRDRGVPENLDITLFEGGVVLLCSEPGPEQCHRRLVADILFSHWRSMGREVEVRHLTSDPGKKRKQKKQSGET